MTSIRDVAKACGVTAMTVSRVFNEPDKISPATRERVLKAVREMGYQPRALRRPPDPSLPATLGVLYKKYMTAGGYLPAILNGVRNRAYDLDQNLLLLPGHLWDADPQKYVRASFDGRCDGLIFIATVPDDPVVCVVRDRGIPFVLVGQPSEEADDSVVDVDNAAEARRATEFLLGQGHRRIAFFGAVSGFPSHHLRYEGYRAAMAGADLRPWPVVGGDDAALSATADALLRLPSAERPTGLVALNDYCALHLLTAARALGVQIPEALSVIGFDDAPEAAVSAPALTTVRQPYDALGGRAFDLLLARLRGGPPERVFLPADLIVRASVAPPGGA